MSHQQVTHGTAPTRRHPPKLARIFAAYLLAACALLCLAPAAAGQQPGEFTRPRRVQRPGVEVLDADEVVRVETDLIPVDVVVTDAAGRSVRGLRPEDFKLFEDGAERPVSFFDVGRRRDPERPLAVVFALDTSGSMTADEMGRLRGAVGAFAERLAARPCFFAVMSFDTNVRRLQGLTNDRRKLERAFGRLEHELGGLSTHAYDVVDDAVRLLARDAPRERGGRPTKRAVVLITDGFPVGDTVAPRTVIERANAADVSVYTVTMPSFSLSGGGAPLPTILDISGLAALTGGRNVYATGDSYEELFRSLAEEVTSSYVLAFYPSEEKRYDGRFHAVRVEGPPALTVRQGRPGYVAAER